MTEEQRIAVARRCPDRFIIIPHSPTVVYVLLNGVYILWDDNVSLNAMHEAEKCLTWEQRGQYNEWLYTNLPEDTNMWHASAEQRADGFISVVALPARPFAKLRAFLSLK